MLRMLTKIISFVLFMILISCSDDDNPATPNDGNAPEQPTLKEITIPEGLKTKQNPYAQMSVGYMQLANSFRAFSGFFSPPASEAIFKSTDDRTFSWEVGGLMVTMNYYYGENIGWEIILNGTDGEHFYADWKYLEGSQNLEGTVGRIACYKEVTTEIDAIWEWEMNENGIYTMTMIFNNDFDKVILIDNGDLSGFVSHYEFHDNVYVLIEKIQHFTDMSGEYWVYDLEGELVNHGTWD